MFCITSRSMWTTMNMIIYISFIRLIRSTIISFTTTNSIVWISNENEQRLDWEEREWSHSMDNIHNLPIVIYNMFHLNEKFFHFIQSIHWIFLFTDHLDTMKNLKKSPMNQWWNPVNVFYLLDKEHLQSYWSKIFFYIFHVQHHIDDLPDNNGYDHLHKFITFIHHLLLHLLQHTASTKDEHGSVIFIREKRREEYLPMGQHPYFPDDNWQQVFWSGHELPSKVNGSKISVWC